MRWPWQSANPDPEPSRERRENSPFTDAVIAGILAASQTSQQGDSSALGALETAAGLWARAFASATISPMNRRTEAITPSILALIGRTLIRRGELVFAIKMIDGELALIPGGTWDVRGPYNESEWLYRVDLFGASEHSTESPVSNTFGGGCSCKICRRSDAALDRTSAPELGKVDRDIGREC